MNLAEHEFYSAREPSNEILSVGYYAHMAHGRGQDPNRPMAESQLVELQNMRVLLEETRVLARNLAYHRRARLEAVLSRALDEVDYQIEDLRRDKG